MESPKRLSARDKLEREMLKLLVRDHDLFVVYAPRLSDEHFRTPSARKAMDALRLTPTATSRWWPPATTRSWAR